VLLPSTIEETEVTATLTTSQVDALPTVPATVTLGVATAVILTVVPLPVHNDEPSLWTNLSSWPAAIVACSTPGLVSIPLDVGVESVIVITCPLAVKEDAGRANTVTLCPSLASPWAVALPAQTIDVLNTAEPRVMLPKACPIPPDARAPIFDNVLTFEKVVSTFPVASPESDTVVLCGARISRDTRQSLLIFAFAVFTVASIGLLTVNVTTGVFADETVRTM
jgi:hypothetical protein